MQFNSIDILVSYSNARIFTDEYKKIIKRVMGIYIVNGLFNIECHKHSISLRILWFAIYIQWNGIYIVRHGVIAYSVSVARCATKRLEIFYFTKYVKLATGVKLRFLINTRAQHLNRIEILVYNRLSPHLKYLIETLNKL